MVPVPRSVVAVAVVLSLIGGVISLRAQQSPAVRDKLLEDVMADPPRAPVSPDEGRAIFDKLCAQCHKFGAIGKDVGPDLTTMTSRLKKKDIVESILWPSKTISDQFEMALIQTKTGDVISGMVQRENAQAVFMVTAQAPDKPIRVLKAQIAQRKKSSVSMMPEGLVDDLGAGPVGSLVAFLLGRPPR
jgi:putative heme-binding domain-containing protein